MFEEHVVKMDMVKLPRNDIKLTDFETEVAHENTLMEIIIDPG